MGFWGSFYCDAGWACEGFAINVVLVLAAWRAIERVVVDLDQWTANQGRAEVVAWLRYAFELVRQI